MYRPYVSYPSLSVSSVRVRDNRSPSGFDSLAVLDEGYGEGKGKGKGKANDRDRKQRKANGWCGGETGSVAQWPYTGRS
jgi:hypothetical protein